MHAEPQFIPLLRLSDLQHHLSKFALHGRLHLAPLKEESVKHALDIATGTGIWAIDFGACFVNSKRFKC
jgi:hypothetical protein